MAQQILRIVILAAGCFYAPFILLLSWRDRARIRMETGSWLLLGVSQFLICIVSCVGIPDFLVNTLLLRETQLTDDRDLPGTLVGCSLLPAIIIAFSLLRVDNPVDPRSLILCGLCIMVGSTTGAYLVDKFDGTMIRRIMLVALVISFFVLIGRMILSSAVSGTTTLSTPMLLLAGIVCLLTAAINMFGIPMKATWTALFLLLGMSPLAALTLVLSLASLSGISGGISVLKNGHYHRKAVLCGSVFGSLGALLGTRAAIALPSGVLNGILLVMMLVAIVSMARK